jgi:predicted nicotinamide N-methyase
VASRDEAVVEEVVPVAGRDLVVARPADAEALLDERAFARDEFMPYWAELWPSGIALARHVGVLALRGARVLELGCGLGLASVAAALAGGRVLATDWSSDAIAFARRNAEANAARLEAAVVGWADRAALAARGPFDLVLGADLVYERRNVELLLGALDGLAPRAIIADPGRPAMPDFLAGARARWEVRTRIVPGGARVEIHELRRR